MCSKRRFLYRGLYRARKLQVRSSTPDEMSLLPMNLSTRELVLKFAFLLILSFAEVAEGQVCSSLNPCQNGATCVPGLPLQYNYTCSCTDEFTGRNCTELSFKASIGIYDVEKYFSIIRGDPGDMTNFKARRLGSRVVMDFVSGGFDSQQIPSTYKWTFNGTALKPATINPRVFVASTGPLIIRQGTLADEGTYQFFSSNEFGTLFSRKIGLKFGVTGNFLFPQTSINVSMVENEPYLLRCPPRAYSYRVEYDWEATAFNSSIAKSQLYAPRILMEPDGNLLFSYVERNDFITFISRQGQYWNPILCKMHGLYDQKVGPPVFFYVNSPATQSPQTWVRFYTQPQGFYNVLTGDQFYLNCTAAGRPVPTIQWYKDGTLLTQSGVLFQLHNYDRTLRLGSISWTNHDGTYKCEATSGLNKVSATFDVRVLDRVSPLYSKSSDQYDLRAGKHGESVTMSCNTTGYPITSRTWYYNGKEVKYSPKFVGRWSQDPLTGDLKITHLRLNDFGFYQCLAKNVLSEDDRKTFLVVTGAPLPPINIRTSGCSNHTANLTWDMRLPADLLPPIGFVIEWRAAPQFSELSWPAFSKLKEISGGAVRSYVVKNLKGGVLIQFRIRAKNTLGVGFPGTLSLSSPCFTPATRPSAHPKNIKGITPKTDGQLSLNWAIIDRLDWGDSICSYQIFYRLKAPNSTWKNKTLSPCGRSLYFFTGLRPNSEYEIAIQAYNSVGLGPSSPIIRVLSGQSQPRPPPYATIIRVDASSVEVQWSAIDVLPPKSVDGYWIFAWTGPFQFKVISDQGAEAEGGGILRSLSSQRLARAVSETLPLPQKETPFPNGTIGVHVNTSLSGVVRGLKAWTRYNVLVTGYNSAGLGDPAILFVTTLDSKDSYYILSMRFTSESFSEDLKNKSSSKYIALERDVTREMSSLYQNHPWFKKVSVLGFRPGSVQADIHLEAASPNMSVVLDVVSKMNQLGNFSVDQNNTKIRSEEAIQSLTLNASNLLLNVRDKIVISCTVIGGPDDLSITWLKAGNVIGLTRRTKVETSFRRSLLTIRNVKARDEGNYTCNASKGIQIRSSTVVISVIPIIEIRPRAVSRRVGDQATFNCTVVGGYRRRASVYIVEVTDQNNKVRHQVLSFTAADLEIPPGGVSHTRRFVCEIWFQQRLLSSSKVAELIIIPSAVPKCPQVLLEGVSWEATATGATDVQPCPNGATGTASRECSADATWKQPSFIGCSSTEYIRLENEIEAITDGFESDLNAQEVLSQLVNVSQPVTNSSTRPTEIYGGDLVIAVNILVTLADYNSNQGNLSSAEDVDNYAQVASNLLDSTNSRTWQNLDDEAQDSSRILVKTIDDYGLAVAAAFNGSTNSITVRTKNLLVAIKRVDQDSPLRTEGLNVSYEQSSIYLPPDAFNAQNSRIITVVYLTLNDVIQLTKDNTADAPVSPNTTVVSSTVVPMPAGNFDSPVKIILQNKRVDVPPGVTPDAKCVFWKPGGSAIWKTSGCKLVASESDVTMTTCECDHLTIFASLMDPFDSSVGEAHQRALEIISIVGCTISLVAVLITIAVTLFFWRVVKSPRAKVLLNLCFAIALSCVFVISEGWVRGNETGCIAIAVLLHYFLLALFSWMLCEGVLLYFLLVKVFGAGAEEKVKYFYIFGWGFPAMVVVISLAATQTAGYGTEDTCWLDVSSGLIWAFIAPAITVISVNIVVFILVIRQMMGTRHVQSKTEIEKVRAGIKASAVVLPLLGITWVFGLLSFSGGTIVFKYIFAIFNSLQGLMIFIFHCLLNVQIKDAIKRRREKSSSGVVSSAPKSKPSPNLKAAKKRSNRAENNYEMMGTLPSDRNNTLTTLPTNSLANKNAIIDIPDDELPEVITRLKNAPVELKDDLPPKEDDSRAASSASEGFAEDNTDEKISLNSLEVHTEARDTNEVTREGSPQERRSDEELVPRYKFSIDGVTNHIYDQLPEEGDPSFKELNKESEAACLTPQEDSSSSSSSDSEEESVLESFKEFDPEVNSEDIDCIIKEAPLEGAPPASSSEETAAHRSAKRAELTQVDDDIKNDDDFEIKMKKRRVKVDTLQRAAEAFSAEKIRRQRSSSQTTWEKMRQKILQGSYTVSHSRDKQDKIPDRSKEDDVDNVELV